MADCLYFSGVEASGRKMFWVVETQEGTITHDTIYGANLDGSEKYTVLYLDRQQVDSMTIMCTTLYYTLSDQDNVMSVDITGKINVAVGPIISSDPGPIYAHKGCGIGGHHHCLRGNGGCSHLCLPGGGQTFQCVCPEGFVLQSDQRNCKAV